MQKDVVSFNTNGYGDFIIWWVPISVMNSWGELEWTSKHSGSLRIPAKDGRIGTERNRRPADGASVQLK